MNTPAAAIVVDNLSFSYERQMVLENASFTVSKGDFLGIIGPNGGGKTTLLRLMLGLLHPASGSIRIDGEPPAVKRRHIGYIPQETGLNKTFPVTVLEVVLMGLSGHRGLFRSLTGNDRLKALRLIERFGLASYVNRPIARLSGGQRQKTLLARAMVADPSMLFLDEPTASVDVAGEDDIYEYLKELNDEGVTVVLVTHNTGVLSRYVKSVACVNKQLFFHADGHIHHVTVKMSFGCVVDLIAHGVPHRVFDHHHHHHSGTTDD